MGINLYSKSILKLLGIWIILPFTLLEINLINKQIKAEKNLIAASEKDLFLYRQMGASYLCIASKAEVDFNKGLGIASATFANVIIGKHGGAIRELGEKKLDEKKLKTFFDCVKIFDLLFNNFLATCKSCLVKLLCIKECLKLIYF